ncbi:Methyl-accepting chemotaxis protein 4 [Stieleria neptunia]|uniref:Methyl-accepting chemotaxis protein 4 n=1 Tax=Stieleria neptunia TaxID=2527979 RepID=A0A518HUM1_9BACT|nr:methyl-accepting chemotaxis protein [Stieleria neptunia]QDV44514.1 Methyl-accepting chemotaxis protein 4 [Stieleria neptunia]
MRIVHQLLIATILPTILIWLVGIYATSVSETSLRQAIETNSVNRAQEVIDEVDWIIQTRATTWQAYLQTDLVRESLRTSNEEMMEVDDPAGLVQQRDRQWRSTPADEFNPLMQQVMNNDLARDFDIWLRQLEKTAGHAVFGEVFLTNRYGANVAQTNRTSDYRQDDESWWQQAVENGLHLEDVSFDESAGIFSVDICLKAVDEDGEFLGVMKAVLNIQELIEIVDKYKRNSQTDGYLLLFDRERNVIHEAGEHSTGLRDGSAYFRDVEFDQNRNAFVANLTDVRDGEALLGAFAFSRGHGDFAGMGWIVLEARNTSTVFAPIKRLRNQIVLLALAATLLVVLAGWLIARSVTRPIDELLEGAYRIGQGELEIRIPVAGQNEVAKLGAGFNQMAANLQSMVDDLKNKEEKLTEQNERLESQRLTLASQEEMLNAQRERDTLFEAIADAVRRLNSTSDDILSTTSKQARGSHDQAAAVSQAASTMNEISSIAHDTAGRANGMVDEAKHVEATAETGREAMEKSIAALESVRRQVEETATHVISLADRAQAIGEITATVDDIAEQTNVLALNAAVEAARTGEHGKGFVVVAAEIKRLAQQSMQSTRQVRDILSEILDAIRKAVESSEQETEVVAEASQVAQQTGNLVQALLETISASASTAKTIASAATRQATGTVQLDQTMQHMEQMTSDHATALQEIEQSAMNLTKLSTELAELTSESAGGRSSTVGKVWPSPRLGEAAHGR